MLQLKTDKIILDPKKRSEMIDEFILFFFSEYVIVDIDNRNNTYWIKGIESSLRIRYIHIQMFSSDFKHHKMAINYKNYEYKINPEEKNSLYKNLGICWFSFINLIDKFSYNLSNNQIEVICNRLLFIDLVLSKKGYKNNGYTKLSNNIIRWLKNDRKKEILRRGNEGI